MGLKHIISGILLIGIALIVMAGMYRNESSALFWLGGSVGLIFFFLGGIGLIFSNLYIKARGNLAFFKTGQGGPKVIKDHGSVVISFLHEVIPVSLETMNLVFSLSRPWSPYPSQWIV